MAANDKETIALHQRNGVSQSEEFGIPLNDLKRLMENRGKDSVTQMKSLYTDVSGVCVLLKTNPNEGNTFLYIHLCSVLGQCSALD